MKFDNLYIFSKKPSYTKLMLFSNKSRKLSLGTCIELNYLCSFMPGISILILLWYSSDEISSQTIVTVCFRLVYTPISEESKSLFLRNHSKFDNMQYIIEKPYKMVTKNAKKNSNFSTFVRFLGPFLKKQRFWKMGNFETDENFWVKLSANLPH